MSDFICFDASLKDGKVGIGIYDNLTKTSTNHIVDCPNNSLMGETIALGYALLQAKRTNRSFVHLFTDNKTLGDQGIPDKFKYITDHIKCTLTWIPRELNKDADLASKHAFFPEVKNPSQSLLKKLQRNKINRADQTDQTGQIDRTDREKKPDQSEQSVYRFFEGSSYQEKLDFIEKLVTNKFEDEIFQLLKSGKKRHYEFQYGTKTDIFIRVVDSIFLKNEFTDYTNRRITKSFDQSKVKGSLDKKQLKELIINRIF